MPLQTDIGLLLTHLDIEQRHGCTMKTQIALILATVLAAVSAFSAVSKTTADGLEQNRTTVPCGLDRVLVAVMSLSLPLSLCNKPIIVLVVPSARCATAPIHILSLTHPHTHTHTHIDCWWSFPVAVKLMQRTYDIDRFDHVVDSHLSLLLLLSPSLSYARMHTVSCHCINPSTTASRDSPP